MIFYEQKTMKCGGKQVSHDCVQNKVSDKHNSEGVNKIINQSRWSFLGVMEEVEVFSSLYRTCADCQRANQTQ